MFNQLTKYALSENVPIYLCENVMCRLCGCTGNSTSYILVKDSCYLVKMIKDETQIKIKEDDILPRTVCRGCVDKVHLIQHFRKQCKKTQQVLKSMVRSNQARKSSGVFGASPKTNSEAISDDVQKSSEVFGIKTDLKNTPLVPQNRVVPGESDDELEMEVEWLRDEFSEYLDESNDGKEKVKIQSDHKYAVLYDDAHTFRKIRVTLNEGALEDESKIVPPKILGRVNQKKVEVLPGDMQEFGEKGEQVLGKTKRKRVEVLPKEKMSKLAKRKKRLVAQMPGRWTTTSVEEEAAVKGEKENSLLYRLLKNSSYTYPKETHPEENPPDDVPESPEKDSEGDKIDESGLKDETCKIYVRLAQSEAGSPLVYRLVKDPHSPDAKNCPTESQRVSENKIYLKPAGNPVEDPSSSQGLLKGPSDPKESASKRPNFKIRTEDIPPWLHQVMNIPSTRFKTTDESVWIQRILKGLSSMEEIPTDPKENQTDPKENLTNPKENQTHAKDNLTDPKRNLTDHSGTQIPKDTESNNPGVGENYSPDQNFEEVLSETGETSCRLVESDDKTPKFYRAKGSDNCNRNDDNIKHKPLKSYSMSDDLKKSVAVDENCAVINGNVSKKPCELLCDSIESRKPNSKIKTEDIIPHWLHKVMNIPSTRFKTTDESVWIQRILKDLSSMEESPTDSKESLTDPKGNLTDSEESSTNPKKNPNDSGESPTNSKVSLTDSKRTQNNRKGNHLTDHLDTKILKDTESKNREVGENSSLDQSLEETQKKNEETSCRLDKTNDETPKFCRAIDSDNCNKNDDDTKYRRMKSWSMNNDRKKSVAVDTSCAVIRKNGSEKSCELFLNSTEPRKLRSKNDKTKYMDSVPRKKSQETRDKLTDISGSEHFQILMAPISKHTDDQLVKTKATVHKTEDSGQIDKIYVKVNNLKGSKVISQRVSSSRRPDDKRTDKNTWDDQAINLSKGEDSGPVCEKSRQMSENDSCRACRSLDLKDNPKKENTDNPLVKTKLKGAKSDETMSKGQSCTKKYTKTPDPIGSKNNESLEDKKEKVTVRDKSKSAKSDESASKSQNSLEKFTKHPEPVEGKNEKKTSSSLCPKLNAAETKASRNDYLLKGSSIINSNENTTRKNFKASYKNSEESLLSNDDVKVEEFQLVEDQNKEKSSPAAYIMIQSTRDDSITSKEDKFKMEVLELIESESSNESSNLPQTQDNNIPHLLRGLNLRPTNKKTKRDNLPSTGDITSIQGKDSVIIIENVLEVEKLQLLQEQTDEDKSSKNSAALLRMQTDRYHQLNDHTYDQQSDKPRGTCVINDKGDEIPKRKSEDPLEGSLINSEILKTVKKKVGKVSKRESEEQFEGSVTRSKVPMREKLSYHRLKDAMNNQRFGKPLEGYIKCNKVLKGKSTGPARKKKSHHRLKDSLNNQRLDKPPRICIINDEVDEGPKGKSKDKPEESLKSSEVPTKEKKSYHQLKDAVNDQSSDKLLKTSVLKNELSKAPKGKFEGSEEVSTREKLSYHQFKDSTNNQSSDKPFKTSIIRDELNEVSKGKSKRPPEKSLMSDKVQMREKQSNQWLKDRTDDQQSDNLETLPITVELKEVPKGESDDPPEGSIISDEVSMKEKESSAGESAGEMRTNKFGLVYWTNAQKFVERISERENKCTICEQIFLHMYLAEEHVRKHIGEKPFACETCGKGFVSGRYLNKHEKVHANGQFTCEVCGKTFHESYTLKDHQRIHQDESPSFHCTICSKTFYTKNNYDSHRLIHAEKRHICEICGKAYALFAMMQRHRKRHGDDHFKCPLCPKIMKSTQEFNQHQKKHERQGLFRCLICSMSFLTNRGLNLHEKIVHCGMQDPLAELENVKEDEINV